MRAFEITAKILERIAANDTDLTLVNFPNADMVGHTGNYNAAVISAEVLDYCLGKIYAALESKLDEYALLVTADHGNSEEMWDYKNQQPHTQHTLNPVPLLLVSDLDCKLDRKESLQDIAPTILYLLDIEKPAVMQGANLILLKK
jgi:2,3-bisphosphoglycerate-independent phosphoglycerate mutase